MKNWDCGGCKASPVNGFPYCPGKEECEFLRIQGLNKMKKLPCSYCGSRGGKRHADSCSRPGRVLKVKQAIVKPAPHSYTSLLRNRIALVIDYSTSMSKLRNDVPRIINEQITKIKKRSLQF